ncbi:MAG: endolytic transglycosylase MltG [Lachnospiraceae bacterium]|nr:endolytic transglycosylase MltG [Lachnospiraceae bacterium]
MSSKTTKTINHITGTIILLAIRVVLVVVVFVIAGKGIKAAYDFGHSIFYAQAVEDAPGHDITVTVKDGDGEKEVAEILKNKGLVDNKYSIIVQAKFFDYEVKPGTYTFNTSQTSREILDQLNDGPPGDETIPDGAGISPVQEETQPDEPFEWLQEDNVSE